MTHTLQTHEAEMPNCADPDCEFHHPEVRELFNGRCEDYPCCGHTPQDPCNYTGPTSKDMLADPARYHIGCDHNTGYCEYEEVDDEEDDDDLECEYAPGGTKADMTCPIHISH